MINNIDVTPIFTALIALIMAIITYYVIPVLRGKISAEQWNEIVKWVKVAVAAAEQMQKAGNLAIPKKDHVITFLKGKGITITDQELDALIEAAVFEINKSKNLLATDLSIHEEVVKSE